MIRRTYLHPLPLRVWHWANAIIVILLLVTGAQLRVTGIPELPRNSPALLIHRYAGWAMAACLIVWLAYSLQSKHLRRHYMLRRSDVKGVVSQTRFYVWSMFRNGVNPHRPSPSQKFNPLQKIAYRAITCIVTPVLIITGLAFCNIQPVRTYLLLWDAARLLDGIHVMAAYLLALYLIVHIYMATLGRTPFAHIKAMILGYGEEPE